MDRKVKDPMNHSPSKYTEPPSFIANEKSLIRNESQFSPNI